MCLKVVNLSNTFLAMVAARGRAGVPMVAARGRAGRKLAIRAGNGVLVLKSHLKQIIVLGGELQPWNHGTRLQQEPAMPNKCQRVRLAQRLMPKGLGGKSFNGQAIQTAVMSQAQLRKQLYKWNKK